MLSIVPVDWVMLCMVPRVVKKTVFFISCFFQEKNMFFSGKKHVFFVFFSFFSVFFPASNFSIF